ncbi:hypothetical protein, partial [Glaesserella parasuis]|uniref:hypothetical protein n=1 Tax=Glaesserella parasuis TaxID=738 RepID=UPI003F3F33CD
YLDGNVVSKRPVEQIDVIVSGTGQSAIVEKIISGHNLVDFSIDDVDTLAREEGQSLTREQINNAVTYLRRRGVVEKRPGRGNWRRRGVVAGTPN